MVENKILDGIANGYILGIPASVYLMLGIFIIVTLLLKYSVFGRMLIAIGSNEEVVRLSGIKVPVYKFMVYSISGALCAIAGIEKKIKAVKHALTKNKIKSFTSQLI